jgi:hypothetical protein
MPSAESKQTRTYPVEVTVSVADEVIATFHGVNAFNRADEYAAALNGPMQPALFKNQD